MFVIIAGHLAFYTHHWLQLIYYCEISLIYLVLDLRYDIFLQDIILDYFNEFKVVQLVFHCT